MSSVPERPLIRVSFDVEQISSYLIWNVFEANGRRNPYSRHGRHAGAIHFRKSEPVLVEVTAFGPPDRFHSMNVLDAMIYTVPHTEGESRSAPSPFSPVRATIPISEWEPAEVGYVDQESKEITQTSITPLHVTQESGRWRFSLIITLQIVSKMPDGSKRREIRVFTFDPEVQVGSGTEPPRGSDGEPGVKRSG
jgi:hypothetical protein